MTGFRDDGISCVMGAAAHGEPDKASLDRLRGRLQAYMAKKESAIINSKRP